MKKAEEFARGQVHGYEGRKPERKRPAAYYIGFNLGDNRRQEEQLTAALGNMHPKPKEDQG